jgi:hypothetical protein
VAQGEKKCAQVSWGRETLGTNQRSAAHPADGLLWKTHHRVVVQHARPTGETAAKHSEILREHKHRASVDGTLASDHTVGRELLILHAEISATVFHVAIVLAE